MPCEHSPVTIFPNAFTYIAINGEQVMTLGAVSLVAHTSGVLPIDRGGTNATTPEQARINLGLGSAATSDSSAFATASQGALADTAMQPGDDAVGLGSGAAIPSGWALTADGAGGTAWMGVQGAMTTATQAEMEAGTVSALRAMSPLLARQGEDARFAAPPVLGSVTPNRGEFTEVRLNNTADEINFERLSLGWNSNRAILGVTQGASALVRPLALQLAGIDRFLISPNTPPIITGTPFIDSIVLGVELLNPDGWTLGAGWTENPAGTFTHTSGTSTLSNNATVISAKQYLLTYTITGRTTGSITVAFGSESKAAITATGAFGPTVLSTAGLVVTPTTDFNGAVQFSLKEITASSANTLTLRHSNGINTLGCVVPPAGGSIGVGNAALSFASSVGLRCLAVGNTALRYMTTGTDNTAIGNSSLQNLTTGSFNVALGQAGTATIASAPVRKVSNGVFIGYNARVLATDDNNSIVIGSDAQGQGSNTTVIGNTNITKTRLQGTVETSLDYESVTAGRGVLLRSLNGTRYRISVTDAGAVIATAAP